MSYHYYQWLVITVAAAAAHVGAVELIVVIAGVSVLVVILQVEVVVVVSFLNESTWTRIYTCVSDVSWPFFQNSVIY